MKTTTQNRKSIKKVTTSTAHKRKSAKKATVLSRQTTAFSHVSRWAAAGLSVAALIVISTVTLGVGHADDPYPLRPADGSVQMYFKPETTPVAPGQAFDADLYVNITSNQQWQTLYQPNGAVATAVFHLTGPVAFADGSKTIMTNKVFSVPTSFRYTVFTGKVDWSVTHWPDAPATATGINFANIGGPATKGAAPQVMTGEYKLMTLHLKSTGSGAASITFDGSQVVRERIDGQPANVGGQSFAVFATTSTDLSVGIGASAPAVTGPTASPTQTTPTTTTPAVVSPAQTTPKQPGAPVVNTSPQATSGTQARSNNGTFSTKPPLIMLSSAPAATKKSLSSTVALVTLIVVVGIVFLQFRHRNSR